ncbi:20349_t:CDS:2 [Gigaspora margarita]|uniref:20349_t:CDS:1 n=1 Tax=Gigaspora margarita TaxID=4874 RepID=A0ABN7VR77_GIGMA|nr:20349_t:CDS:2 [Gigaspora margarita]
MEVDTLSIILLCLIVFFTFLSIREAPNSDVHPLLLTSQSDAAKVRYPGETAVYRSNNSQHGMPLLTTPENGVKTIAQMFQHGLEEGKDCLGSRDINGAYTWQTYRQIFERIINFGSGLIKRTGLTSKSQDKFGIFMKNCPGINCFSFDHLWYLNDKTYLYCFKIFVEWVIADLAACHYSLITVALPSIRPRVNDVINQINLTEISIIVVSKDTLQIAFSAAPSCKTLKYIIITESSLTKDQNEKAENLGLTLTTFNDIEKLGSTSKLECVPAAGILATIHITQKIKTSDRHLSYLPLAYVFERITVMTLLFSGASIAFYSGKISTVLKDAEEVKPTIFTSTPRILSLFHENILKSLENKWFFKRGFNSKLKSLKKGSLVTNSIWDILVFNQVKAKFGGQVRVIVTASDPIPQTLLDFFRITVGCQVLQSYGLTQCSGAVTINAFYDYYSIDQNGNDSHTGGPLACNEIKLINYEERGYTVEDVPNPRGEICVRGPNVMKGYYNLPDETSRIIDADGWFHTGDIGMILPNGTLKIIDRK